MNVEEIVKELKYCTGVFPRQSLQEAVARKEEITPALLMIIEDAKLLPPVLHDENYMAHIYAMYLLAQFRETTRKYIGHMLRVVRANEIPSQTTEVLGGFGVALVFVYLVLSADPLKPPAMPSNFIAFIVSFGMMYPSIKNLTRLQNQLQQARSANQRVFELLDTVSTITDPPKPVPLQAKQADIHFDNVDFDYGEKPVLRGINLTVKAGRLVALVGSSGSGKTTLTNLLLRFYDPQRGAVRIGATDIRQVAINDLRRQIALVTQEIILFNATIRHNISLGRPGATEVEIDVRPPDGPLLPHPHPRVQREQQHRLRRCTARRRDQCRRLVRTVPIE